MSETAWTSWYDEVMPELPGAPPAALVKNAIRNAAIEFCDRTWVYRVPHDPISSAGNVAEYDIETPTKTKPVKLHRVWYDKKEIFPKTADELAALYSHWPSASGTPLYFTQRRFDAVILVPIPTASISSAITAEIAIKPSRAATGISSDIYEKYLEEIAYGAKARLFAMKAKPWSDAKLAAFNLGMFEQAVGRTKVQAVKGHTRAKLRVRAHFY
jgi:hypothetical protein